MKKRLGINTFNFIGAIIGAVMTGTMLFWMFSDSATFTYYFCGAFLLVTNIIGLVKQKKNKGKVSGNVLGVIASAFHMLTGILAFPAMILYIIASVFTCKNKVEIEPVL